MEETFLKSVTLFAEFEAAELQALARSLQMTRFNAGDTILALVENPTFRQAYAMCNR